MTYFELCERTLASVEGTIYPPKGTIIRIHGKEYRIMGHYTELVEESDGDGCLMTVPRVIVQVYYL